MIRVLRVSKSARSVLARLANVQSRGASITVSQGKGPFEYLMITIPVVSFGLGVWQVYRWRWKVNLVEKLETRIIKDQPVDFPQNILDNYDEWEYKKVKVKGKFDHSQEVYVGPKSRFDSGAKSTGEGSLMSVRGDGPGVYVITPFVLNDGTRILVNRGWVSWRNMRPCTRMQGQIEGEVELIGVIRKNETRPPFGAKIDLTKETLPYKDIDFMSHRLKTEPILIDADESSSVPGGPIGGQTRVNLRNEHVSYFLTWFTLCFVTISLYRKSLGKGARKMII